MEVVTADRVEQVEAEQALDVPASRTSAHKMFKYSEYVHVGAGAAECPTAMAIAAGEVEIPKCDDPEHFHAWCRLPNPYQHEDIRKKGLAAKARKIRELKDPESDASVVLDHDLSSIDDPLLSETIIDELVAREWGEDYLQSEQDVQEREEFEHVNQDREEYNRIKDDQTDLPEDEQSDEFKRLLAHMTAYVDALRDRMTEIQEPKRAELRERPIDSLVALVRSRRVEEEGDKAFLETYNPWQWFVGTFKVEPHKTLRRPHLPMWDDIGVKDRPATGTMFGEAPEVIEALKATFNELSIALQRGSAGN